MAAQQILIWEDDPASPGVLIMAAKPNIGQIPFKYTFPPPALATSQHSNTPQFRYWNAAAALRRGADFWGPNVVRGQWFRGPALTVRLEVGPGWNAGYDRQALNFYYGVSSAATIYAVASPDMLCHELGHAMLDAIEELLWNTLALEIEAFHELFGDMSAILCSLQIPSMRDSRSGVSGSDGREFLRQLKVVANCSAIRYSPLPNLSQRRRAGLPAQCGEPFLLL